MSTLLAQWDAKDRDTWADEIGVMPTTDELEKDLGLDDTRAWVASVKSQRRDGKFMIAGGQL